MNKPNLPGYKQLLAEISTTRDVLTGLNTFFSEADENILNDPDDPRDGIGRFFGLDRLMLVLPCVITRLEKDISESRESEDVTPVTQGLQAISEGLNSVFTYYHQDDVAGAFNLLSNAITKIDKLSNRIAPSSIRFLNDLERVAPDFHILLDTFEGFRETKNTRPVQPESNESWSPEHWLAYISNKPGLKNHS